MPPETTWCRIDHHARPIHKSPVITFLIKKSIISRTSCERPMLYNGGRLKPCSMSFMFTTRICMKIFGPRALRSFCRELRFFNQQTNHATKKHMVQDRLPRPTNKQVAVQEIDYFERRMNKRVEITSLRFQSLEHTQACCSSSASRANTIFRLQNRPPCVMRKLL